MSFDFIPIQQYSSIYYYILLIFVVVTFVHTQVKILGSSANIFFTKVLGSLVFLFVLLYLGVRPIDDIFIDMVVYNNIFETYALGGEITSVKDIFFHSFTKFLSSIVSAQIYFFVITCLYVIPLYLVCKKWFKQYWFYGFIFLISAFSFWAFGTNTIRNGVAGSLFLLGISRDKRIWQIALIIISLGFHKTMLLPTGAYILSSFYNRPKNYLFFWFVCIGLSIVFGDLFKMYIGELGIDETRMSYFTAEVEVGKFSKTGFRWDFLLYGSIGIFAGWYYTYIKKFEDKMYAKLFNTYLIANSFWVLVNTAIFSDRFAYLSWFIMPLLIIYPLIKQKMFFHQHKKIGVILLAYFGFTFIMFLI